MRFFLPAVLAVLMAPVDVHGQAEPGGTAEVDRYPIVVDGRAGFIDRTGKLVIHPRFDAVSAFSDGLARVKLGVTETPEGAMTGGAYGFVDPAGNFVIPASHGYAHDFSEGRAAVRVGRLTGYVDHAGKLAIPAAYLRGKDFHEGRAAVEVAHDRWAFIDRDGEVVFALPPDTDLSDVPRFHAGHVGVALRRRRPIRATRWYDRDGKVVAELPFGAARTLSEGLVAVRDAEKELWGFVDLKGRWVLAPAWPFAWGFRDGRALVKLPNGRSAFIDKAGKVLLAGQTGDVLDGVSEGLVRFRRADRYGYLDLSGKVIVEPIWEPPYNQLERFTGGLALVARTRGEAHEEGYIDRSGAMVWAPTPSRWRPAR